MRLIQKISIYYLVAVIFLGWGIAIGKYQVFPYFFLKEVQDEAQEFAKGHELEIKTSVGDKILNDLGLEPRRFIKKYPADSLKHTKLIDLPGAKSRRESPRMFIDPEHQEGYRAIFGAFDFQTSLWGGILLSPNGGIIHTWQLSTDHLPTSKTHEALKNLYGLHLFPDGSVIFTQQEDGGGIVKVDVCSKEVWNLKGEFHHTISPTEDGFFWTFMGSQQAFDHKLAKVSVKSGKAERIIDMAEVRKSNPFVHIFNLQRRQKNLDSSDISHGNDIDPLSKELSSKFVQFKEGDLLISYRTQNLVFILDPETLEVKWWRIGGWDRQHDPDWESDGTISVFSNNEITAREKSDIISINPSSLDYHVVVDGEKFNFYSPINGDHERSPFGTHMVTSSTQGWVFEVDDSSKLIFSFVNNYESQEQESLQLSEAVRLDEQYFDGEIWSQCQN